MRSTLDRLYRTKTVLTRVLLVVAGVVLLVLADQLDSSRSLHWLSRLPWRETGGILLGAGLLSMWLDQFLQRERDEIDDQRLRRLLHEQAPAMRDAVLEAFAANQSDLQRVATPETLDRIVSNSLALRLGDEQFAREVYEDVRDQALRASERWYDSSISIELNPLPEGTNVPAREGRAEDYFMVTVRREYTVVPMHPQRRFVCLSDREEYRELSSEQGDTSVWFLKPGGVEAGSQLAFELLRFSVDGESRSIRRSTRRNGQAYTASIGIELVSAGNPVNISYTYRTLTRRAGHLLFFDAERPTRDLRIDLEYDGCGISAMSAIDLVSGGRPARVERSNSGAEDDRLRVTVDGWVFPRSGVAFVWGLQSEEAGNSAWQGRR